MDGEKLWAGKVGSLFVLLSLILFPLAVFAAETPAQHLEEAKLALDQARKAGAEQKAFDDLAAARLWLAQGEKAYGEAKSLLSLISTAKAKKAKEEEIIFLATMAKLKGLTAEAKAKRDAVAAELLDVQKDLTDYRSALAVLKKGVAEAEQAKEVQAKAEVELKQLEEAQRKVAEIEAQKRKELEAVQQKAAGLEALKERALLEGRLKEARLVAEREKEALEARLKAEQLQTQRAKEAAVLKAREEKLSAGKQELAILQAKVQALEREKTMLTEAGKIPHVTVKTGVNKVIFTILAQDLFTPAQELKTGGKEILDKVGSFLKTYVHNDITVRGHTDSLGKPAANQALSEKRAQKVREYLVAYQNVPSERVTAEGMGAGEPAATNANEAGRALNRRVELTFPLEPLRE